MIDGARTNRLTAARRRQGWLMQLLRLWTPGKVRLDPERLNDHLRRDLGFQDGHVPPPRDPWG